MSTHQSGITAHYDALVRAHGQDPASTQMSAAGQVFRFAKLMDIAPLDGRDVLDLGCGTGAFYPAMRARFPAVRYHGLDIVPTMIDVARRSFPEAHFVTRDVLAEGLPETYDYVLTSGVFNNARPDDGDFRRRMLKTAFASCRAGLGFNFISTHVSRRDAELAYADPAEVLAFCIAELSPRVVLDHHYERRDVSVFVYR